MWREARELIWSHRYRLAAGFGLMFFNRMLGLILPASSKVLIDEVIGKQRTDLLWVIAFAAGAATLLQAITSFVLTQVLGVAAQRVITEMRKSLQSHVARLPVRYFDSTQTGALISRIMSDAEGIRNLVGTGLVQLAGGLVTASAALAVLFYLSWKLTTVTLLVLGVFGGALAFAFKRLRPLFRERSKISAEVTGRLGESIGGIRIVKAYSAERRETLVFARGAHRLLRNVVSTMTGVSGVTAFSTVVVGLIGVVMIVVGGRSILAGEMTLGDFVMYVFFTALVAAPV
ncbi:MAG: ABC transporter ATP-binding protein, partial [Acidobacteria bacterium]|nr:ABC transporter ATP-binding protein [Acidobacteriota bacterium]